MMGHFSVSTTRPQRRWGALLVMISIAAAAVDNETSADGSHQDPSVCGIYLAQSTIPGAGLGMFAGHYDYQENDLVGDSDLVIPVYDMKWNNFYNDDYVFLWEDYTWRAVSFKGMTEETTNINTVKACSPGENVVFAVVPRSRLVATRGVCLQ